MTGPAYGIRLTIDATGAKTGGDTYVRTIEDIKRATPQATSTVAALSAELRKLGIAEDLIQKQMLTQVTAAKAQAAATVTTSQTVAALATAEAKLAGANDVAATSHKRLAAAQSEAKAAAFQAAGAASALADAQLLSARGFNAVQPAIGGTTAAMGTATTGTGKLFNSLQTLAFAATGLPGPLGRVAGSLGALAIGGGVTIAVTTGIAAIAFAWDRLTGESRKAKQATDELIASLLEAARVRSGQTARETRAEAEQRVRDETARVARFDATLALPNLEGRDQIEANRLKAIEKRKEAIEALGEVYNRDAEKYVEGVERQNAKDRERASEQKRLADEAKRVREERLKQIGILGDAERQGALERATSTKDELAALVAIRDAKIASQIISSGLKGEEAERLRVLLLQSAQLKEQNELLSEQGKIAAAVADQQAAFLRTQEALIAKLRQAPADLADPGRFGPTGLRKLDGLFSREDAIDLLAGRNKKVTDDAAKEAEQRFEAAVRTITDSFQRGFLEMLKGRGVSGFFDGLVGLAQQAAATIAATFAVQTLGLDNLLKKITSGGKLSGLEKLGVGAGLGVAIGAASGNAGIGLLGGAAAGGLAGGPFGAIAGGVAGFVSGLFSSAAKAREAALKMAEARRAFEISMADFARIANPRGPLGDAIANLTRQAQELQKAAVAAVGGDAKARQQILGAGDVTKLSQAEIQRALDLKNEEIAHGGSGRAARDYLVELLKLRKAYDENVEATRKLIAEQKERLLEDLGVRNLRARGLDAEADAMAFLIGQERERRELLKTMGDEIDQLLLAQLDYVHAVEREARIKQEAAKQLAIGLSLAEREAGLRGDTAGGLRARRDRELLEANQQRDSGALSGENYQRLIAIIFGEFDKALQQVADEAEAAALALFTYNRAAREDLQVRLLLAQGQASAAEDLRYRLEQEREYAQALRDGADATTLAMLTQVQAAEAIARAQQRATEEAKRLADALAQEARAMEDLIVRMLRATGQGGAADEGAQLFAQQEERRRAIEAGRSQAFLDELERVQRQERAFADKARREAQQRAFDESFPTTTSREIAASATTVNLAVGLSETTGSRMAGLMASQLSVLNQQLAFQAYLPRIFVQLQAMGGGAGAGNPDDLDVLLAGQDADANRAAGIPPGNH